ncbi:hypothetical protein A2572_04600 [Candidatus Collierbacteria bacterium RIFOXYD1_FULL_40_9]|uniref:PABS domain-containing protein n=1 Tax=Candidatus Collierbacteria bacterium RIFOXYD1_FULL_40_9 TaxID=1817731 RepID=A0A1F5FTU5_9BACT|nr:MAG: hypothetical protein A2572_04600 [Candidatus Collierbacteria bacterium RIFOXYD1_FULL_40_9]
MFRKIFFPQTIQIKDNLYNTNITLIDHYPEPTVIVDGLIESGRLLRQIWRTGITKLVEKHQEIKTILVLGVGGGSNVRLVSKLYPHAKITAIEIDPQMVELANKYFGLDKIKNLNLITQDAIKYVNNLQSIAYDLVLVDCFVGKNIPTNVQDLDFIKKLSQHSKNLLINRIWYNEHHPETVFFLRKMSSYFTCIKVHTPTNIIVKLI